MQRIIRSFVLNLTVYSLPSIHFNAFFQKTYQSLRNMRNISIPKHPYEPSWGDRNKFKCSMQRMWWFFIWGSRLHPCSSSIVPPTLVRAYIHLVPCRAISAFIRVKNSFCTVGPQYTHQIRHTLINVSKREFSVEYLHDKIFCKSLA